MLPQPDALLRTAVNRDAAVQLALLRGQLTASFAQFRLARQLSFPVEARSRSALLAQLTDAAKELGQALAAALLCAAGRLNGGVDSILLRPKAQDLALGRLLIGIGKAPVERFPLLVQRSIACLIRCKRGLLCMKAFLKLAQQLLLFRELCVECVFFVELLFLLDDF